MKRRFDPDKLATKFAETWYADYGGSSLARTRSVAEVEATVHELSHGAVFFGKSFLDRLDGHGDIGALVMNCFDLYKSEYASDISELKAIAVEILVMRKLGLTIFTNRLIRGAMMRCVWEHRERHRFIRRFLREPLTKKRAEIVLGWIDRAMARSQNAPSSIPG